MKTFYNKERTTSKSLINFVQYLQSQETTYLITKMLIFNIFSVPKPILQLKN